MVAFTKPTFVSKRAFKAAEDPEWSDEATRTDAPNPRTMTCTRCFLNMGKNKKTCDMRNTKACGVCLDGHRGQCHEVPSEFYGRYEQLYILREKLDTEVAKFPSLREASDKPAVKAAGLQLAIHQRLATREFMRFKKNRRMFGLPVIRRPPTTANEFSSLALEASHLQTKKMDQLATIGRDLVDAVDTMAGNLQASLSGIEAAIRTLTNAVAPVARMGPPTRQPGPSAGAGSRSAHAHRSSLKRRREDDAQSERTAPRFVTPPATAAVAGEDLLDPPTPGGGFQLATSAAPGPRQSQTPSAAGDREGSTVSDPFVSGEEDE